MSKSGNNITNTTKIRWVLFISIVFISMALASCSSSEIQLAPPQVKTTSKPPAGSTSATAGSTTSRTTTTSSSKTTTTSKTTVTSTTAITGITDTAKAGTKYFSISFDKADIHPGDEFTVNILVTTDTPIRGLQCDLDFDRSAVQCVYVGNNPTSPYTASVAEGTFFKDWVTKQNSDNLGTILIQPKKLTDTSSHLIALGISVTGITDLENKTSQFGGATGTGIVFTCKMKALPGINKLVTFSISNVAVQTVNNATRDSADVPGFKTVIKQIQIGP